MPTITSEALMTAYASLPGASFRSSTAALVMDDVTMVPPISILTCAVVAPLVTSTIVPLSTLRALIFMSSLPFPCHCGGQQYVDLLLGQIDVVEELVELERGVAKALGEPLGVEDRGEPAHTDQAVYSWRSVEPAVREVGGEIDAAVANRLDGAPQRVGRHAAI